MLTYTYTILNIITSDGGRKPRLYFGSTVQKLKLNFNYRILKLYATLYFNRKHCINESLYNLTF